MSTEYKIMTQLCVVIFVLDLLILCLMVKAYLTILIFFLKIIFKKNDDIILNYFLNKL